MTKATGGDLVSTVVEGNAGVDTIGVVDDDMVNDGNGRTGGDGDRVTQDGNANARAGVVVGGGGVDSRMAALL